MLASRAGGYRLGKERVGFVDQGGGFVVAWAINANKLINMVQ